MPGLFNAPRALTVKSPAIPVLAGQPALVPLKLEGSEGVNSLFEYRLTLQTPDALNFMAGTGSNFDLDAFVGLELTGFVELEGHGSLAVGLPGGGGAANQGAGVREISGVITQARFVGDESSYNSASKAVDDFVGKTKAKVKALEKTAESAAKKVFQNAEDLLQEGVKDVQDGWNANRAWLGL